MLRQATFSVVLLGLAVNAVPPLATGPATDKKAAAPPAPSLTVSPATLSVKEIAHGGAEIPLVVANTGSAPAYIWFEPVLMDVHGHAMDAKAFARWRDDPPPSPLKAGDIKSVTLVIQPTQPLFGYRSDERLPARGSIGIYSRTEASAEAAKVEVRDLTIPQIQPEPLEGQMLFWLFVAAFACTLTARVRTKQQPSIPGGPAVWSPDSVGTNVALGTGLATALFGLSTLPQVTVYASRPTYGFLIAMFAVLVALGSPVANLLGKAKRPQVAFFAAVTFVLWGALGQFAVAWYLIRELWNAAAIGQPVALLLFGLVIVLALAMVIYVFHTTTHPEQRELDTATAPRTFGATVDHAGKSGWSLP